ncbi:SDR family oxidoreductase [Streptomyces zagrosensis]|uniref:Nucleoside-diphosphate-sugar epimerase n=1 Tax=Streptomyces zagrosensis TaxID=1042984 RepID=A0A7W9V237_9ACTN|nr:SDR family oxidoreductase [Streptomyces zagrosensis]MBB5938429.1 nucleoside-diphosphate-sugar epimerase [Streptomyces zagrosensis]
MSVLLTGATGFLGCRLLRELLAHGQDEVIVLGRGTPEDLRHRVEAAVRWLRTPPLTPDALAAVRYVSGDLTRPGLGLRPAERAQLTGNLSALWHCAALLQLGSDPAPLHLANVVGTRRILDLADEAPEARLLHVSTAYVAGRRASGVVMEDDLLHTAGFQVPYEESKHTAERLVHAWAQRGERAVTVFRPSLLVTDRPVPDGLPSQPADAMLRPLERHLGSWAKQVSPVRGLLHRPRGEVDRPRAMHLGVTGDPQGSLNMLQADYAAHAMVRAATRLTPTPGVRTLHVTHPHNVLFATAVAALRTRFPDLTVTMTEQLSRPTLLERQAARLAEASLLAYSTHRRTYDRTNLIAALDGLPDPAPVDESYLSRAFGRAEVPVAG